MANEFGDFQTPPELVKAILDCLYSTGNKWERVLEPTCGKGNFISGLIQLEAAPLEIQGIELQGAYVTQAREIAPTNSSTKITIRQENIFELNLTRTLEWRNSGRLLVLGNPPWITNAALGVLNSTNLPIKTNLKRLKGIEALTGKSNFDIAEYIWIKLLTELIEEQPTIALLCKTSVARNVLEYAYHAHLPINYASIRKIDSKKWFDAAVDACLFYVETGSNNCEYLAEVFSDLDSTRPESKMGMVDGQLVSDVETYKSLTFGMGISPVTWRQGLKHDAASVMELANDQTNYWNKFGEPVCVEADYIYPLLKSSDLARQAIIHPDKAVIVTQSFLGEDTTKLQEQAPRLWQYLNTYLSNFEQRKSSIYINQPPFAIFGIGQYSFAPYKVAVSGLHKKIKFRAIGPVNKRPVVLDDTCYFITCTSYTQAAFLSSLLNHPTCISLLYSLAFSDAKRPITKKLLQRIDLRAMLGHLDHQSLVAKFNEELEGLQQSKAGLATLEEEIINFSGQLSFTW